MIVVEKYSYHKGIRVIDKVEYEDYESWEKDLMLEKLSGTWVGHKIYPVSMEEFDGLTPDARSGLPYEQDFDKAAWLNNSNSIIQGINSINKKRGLDK